jgi:predicted membrane channel-forming protein YqfA (hemolysin III family)
MKSPANLIVFAVGGLMVVAALAPQLIALSHALVPLVVAAGVVVIVVRLVFFHTRRW